MITLLESHLFPASACYCYVRTGSDRGVLGGHGLGAVPVPVPVPVSGADLSHYAQLHPLEQTLVAQAVDIRKAEFGDARWCAHQALAQLGAPPGAPILQGERGMPVWPEGFVGSITHTPGLRAAVVAPAAVVRSLGLDVEPAEPLPPGVLAAIARPQEYRQVEQWQAAGITYADKLLFCAKEATYKAWFPLAKRFLDFAEAEIVLHREGTWESRILQQPTPVPTIRGSWLVRDGFVVVSAVVLPNGH